MDKIGVGIIGASTLNPGWAVAAHLPALRALPAYELRAVGTSNASSATAASRDLGVPAFTDYHKLIAHPGVDLVVVAVRLADHRAPIEASLRAGKMVLSEWPLGASLAEAEALAKQAEVAGVRTAIGLQARFSPAVQHARRLIAGGYLGEVLATVLVGSGIGWGPETDRSHAYAYDAANGATTLTVPALHAIDAISFMLGDLAFAGAHLGQGRRTVHLRDEHRSLPVSAPDQVAIFGNLSSGATVSIFYRGGISRGSNLLWEINGTEGDLVLHSSLGNVQVADLRLSAGRRKEQQVAEIDVPDRALPAGIAEVPAGNVYRLYRELAEDLRTGGRTVPDFAHALRRHRLIAALQEAAAKPLAVSP
jgi:predicted dehydrogenase